MREIERKGGGDYLAVSSSFDLFKLKMLPAIRSAFEEAQQIGRYWASNRVLEIMHPTRGFLAKTADDPMYARVIMRSASSGGGLESSTAKAAWLDEAGQDAFTLEDWEAVLRRVALNQGRVLISSTPYNMGWLRTEVYRRWTDGDPAYEVIQFASILNPAFPKAEFERARDTMPAWRFEMFYRGLFTRPAGLIYDAFDPDVHIVDGEPPPAIWPRYVGIDFGSVNTALVWAAHCRASDHYVIYRESLSGGKSTREHAAAAKALAVGLNMGGWWGGAPSEDQQRMDWTAAGIPVRRPIVKDVEAGIDRVTRLLKERRLSVHRSCKGLIDEFGSYRRKLSPDGQPTDIIEDKRMYHRLDSLRYLATGLLPGSSGVMGAGSGPERPRG